MKKLLGPALLILVTVMLVALVGGATIANNTDDGMGQEAFIGQKCNSCHGVPGVGIEAKTKSAAMKGPDLPTAAIKDPATERDALLKYVRKESELDGKKHKKGSTATDEELNTVIDWLATQEVAPEAE